jgi:sulfide:quinone oxidoreductase
MSDFRVVIFGGGIAAVEGLLRARRLLGGSAELRLIAPNDDVVYRPLAVREPFAGGPPTRRPLKRIAADCGAELTQDALEWVDRDAQVAHMASGGKVEYDALLVAVGGRQAAAFDHVRTFDDASADETYRGILQDIEDGYSGSIAFLLPDGPVWPLPLYELTLMTAERARSMGIDGLEITLVTPEAAPLAIFGSGVSEALTERLRSAGVSVHAAAEAEVPEARRLLVQPQGVELRPERMISMPRVQGPAIRGLGGGSDGFIPIDRHCSVPGSGGRVFAAGDAAAYPVKHGGLGAQMADTAVAAIARLAGVDAEAPPFQPVIRGKLLTGGDPLYISARLVGSAGFESEVHDEPPWPQDDKVVAEELGAYFAAGQ